MPPKRAKLTGIKQFFKVKPAPVDETPDVVDENKRDASENNAARDSTPSMSTPMHADEVDSSSDNEGHDGKGSAPTVGLSEKPNHPDAKIIPAQKRKHQNVNFQTRWFAEYPWLHYVPEMQKVVCFCCAKAERAELFSIAGDRSLETTFISKGFNNWKKATQKFVEHQSSSQHKFALSQLAATKSLAVNTQLDDQHRRQQQAAGKSLIKVVRAVRYLLRQGLAFRGHNDDEGNFMQLLNLMAEDDKELQLYMCKKTKYVSPQAQNELIEMFGDVIVRKQASDMQKNNIFAILVDGTQDITGEEQQSICIRYVDEELTVHETFLGLYNVASTTGDALSSMVFDVLIRLNLPITGLRAQTYDGASNMSGAYNGCQAKVKEQQPLAMFFHCGAHMANLVMQHAANACICVRDAIQWVNELGVLFKRSGKYKAIFQAIASEERNDPVAARSIRPLCPTRWLCRLAAIECALASYGTILDSLHEMSQQTGDTAVKARGLHDVFRKGTTLLGLYMAQKPLALLEQLNSSLQATTANVSGMLAATDIAIAQLKLWRSEEEYSVVFNNAQSKIDLLDIDPIKIPRTRKPPARLAGNAPAHHAISARDHFRSQYFEYVDTALQQLVSRFEADKNNDLQRYMALEAMITTGTVNVEIATMYPDINVKKLTYQLPMFKGTTGTAQLHDAKLAYRGMDDTCRLMFSEVFVLMKLLLVCPVSSCACERSFSALRRLKTWLRSTQTQKRLNHIAVCHVHKAELDSVDVHQVAKVFATKSAHRRSAFGNNV